MTTIYKFPLEATYIQWINMPKDAQILTVQIQAQEPFIWARVDLDPSEPFVPRKIIIYGTGGTILNTDESYIGTVQLESLVLHVFEGPLE